MANAFERLGEEYLRLQEGPGYHAVRVGNIICPETLSLSQAGLRTPQAAHADLRLKGRAAYDQFVGGFIQPWDPEIYERVQAHWANTRGFSSNWFQAKPITVAELRHAD